MAKKKVLSTVQALRNLCPKMTGKETTKKTITGCVQDIAENYTGGGGGNLVLARILGIYYSEGADGPLNEYVNKIASADPKTRPELMTHYGNQWYDPLPIVYKRGELITLRDKILVKVMDADNPEDGWQDVEWEYIPVGLDNGWLVQTNIAPEKDTDFIGISGYQATFFRNPWIYEIEDMKVWRPGLTELQPPEPPELSGHTFVGWVNCWAEEYYNVVDQANQGNPPEIVDFSNLQEVGVTEFCPWYDPTPGEICKATFFPYPYDTSMYSSVMFVVGDGVTPPLEPEYEGHQLAGWIQCGSTEQYGLIVQQAEQGIPPETVDLSDLQYDDNWEFMPWYNPPLHMEHE